MSREMARTGVKRERKKIPKAERKNLRLWAEGARETILAPHLDGYTAAMDKGRLKERQYVRSVCAEFHARVDWRTEDHEEPVLRDWNPAEPISKEQLGEEEELEKRRRLKVLNAVSHWCDTCDDETS